MKRTGLRLKIMSTKEATVLSFRKKSTMSSSSEECKNKMIECRMQSRKVKVRLKES